MKKVKTLLDVKVEAMSDKNTKKEESIGYCQWGVAQNGTYRPAYKSVKNVPSGVYELHSDNNGIFIQQQRVVLSDNILKLPMPIMEEIILDIKNFWEMEDRFRKYKMVHKRGILMHGPPGAGKSYLIQNLINNIIKLDGIVLSLNGEPQVEMFIQFIQTFRAIEPTRPLVVILEDIDNIVTAGHGLLSGLLNILDGVNQIENVVYLATTNYPEKLQDRISNRPSRFDRVYEIGTPSAEVREFFIKHKLHADDLKNIDMKKWVKNTDGLSLSHIKELIVSTMILGKEFDDVMEHFDGMKKPKSSRSAMTKVGFNN